MLSRARQIRYIETKHKTKIQEAKNLPEIKNKPLI